ncbi:MAG: Gfo/Idh/MocA family protein [Candidatus Woesearchaeota archaeon]
MVRLNSPQTLRIIEAIIRLKSFTQQGLSHDTSVSIGLVNRTVTFLLQKGLLEKTRKGYVLSDERGLLRALSLYSYEDDDNSFLPEGDSKYRIGIALKGNSKDIDRLFMTDNNDRLKIGIVGLGVVGRNHYNTMMKMDTVDVISVSDIMHKDLHSHIRFYESYHEMIGSELLDGIVIASPSNTHNDIILSGLNNNIMMLCETPLTDSYKSLLSVVDEENVFVGCTEAYNPVMNKLLEIIDGKIIFFDSYRQGPYPSEHRMGNALFNLGLHDIMNATMLLGDLELVSGISNKLSSSRGKDAYRLLLKADKTIVSMSIDWTSSIKERRYVIGLEDKTIHADLIRQEIRVYYGIRRDKSYAYEEQIKGVIAGDMRMLSVDKREPFMAVYDHFIPYTNKDDDAIAREIRMKEYYKKSYKILDKALRIIK